MVFRFWFINQARAGLPWFMSVYRRREPDNSSKIAVGDTTTNKWVWIFFYGGTSTFSFLSLSLCCEQPGKQSSARSTSSKYRRSYGKHNKLFLVLFRIFLTAFPFKKDGCKHSSSSPFPAGNHEYTFEDWRERTKKITGSAKTRSLSRKLPYFPFEFRSRIKFSVLFSFSVWNQTIRHFVTMEIVPLKWKSFLLYALIPIPVDKPE